jgi:alpha-D-xyloside xylohydrolase
MNMKITKWMLSAVFLFFAAAVSAADFVQNGNQIIVRLQSPEQDGPRLVCLQVVGDRIIRVRATAEDSFPVKQSLIIVPQTANPDSRVAREGDLVVVRTSKIKAEVNLKTGRVAFYHPDNRLYLQETALGGKMIRPYVVPTRDIGVGQLTDAQRKGWSYRILFDSPSDEAFYGLGQHQAGELDMKGLNEDLFQYNTKVSVPFVVSNHNYGILWDSYSYCRFGNPNPYQQLNHAFTLYDRNGKSGAVNGSLYG